MIDPQERVVKKVIPREERDEILRKHKLWLEYEEDGERANLAGANLLGVDMAGANLTMADLSGANLSRANLSRANLTRTNLSQANLSLANLSRAELTQARLTGADLSGANLDCSVVPLWCGSLKANFDDRQLVQIAYHLVKAGLNSDNASEETKAELEKLIDFANKFHRVDECGKIEKREETGND